MRGASPEQGCCCVQTKEPGALAAAVCPQGRNNKLTGSASARKSRLQTLDTRQSHHAYAIPGPSATDQRLASLPRNAYFHKPPRTASDYSRSRRQFNRRSENLRRGTSNTRLHPGRAPSISTVIARLELTSPSRHVSTSELASATQPPSSGRDPDWTQVAHDGSQCRSPGCPDGADGH